MPGDALGCDAATTGCLCGRGMQTLREGVWTNNPVAIQILGICPALAVTGKLANALAMAGALLFVVTMSNLLVSLLRNITPRRIRMIAEMAIIATFVIIVDQFLKAFWWDMSKQLGPYVPLIITNCTVMGRAEAFGLQNPPLLSAVDGIANGLGFGLILAIIGFSRELLGYGTVLEYAVLSPTWYPANGVVNTAPGAFLALGFVVAALNIASGRTEKE